MNESYVTLQGWVGADTSVRAVGDTECVSFRVGSTPRYFREGAWTDGQTSWFTVNCWRTLGQHVKESVRRGDAVVVHGRVRVDTWERQGLPPGLAWIVDATFVGHDLNRGTSTFAKTARAGTDHREGETTGEVLAAYDAETARGDGGGQAVQPATPSTAA